MQFDFIGTLDTPGVADWFVDPGVAEVDVHCHWASCWACSLTSVR